MSLSLSLSPLFALVACPAHHTPVLSLYSLICLSDRLSLNVPHTQDTCQGRNHVVLQLAQSTLGTFYSMWTPTCVNIRICVYVYVCVSFTPAFKCNLNDPTVSFMGDKMFMIRCWTKALILARFNSQQLWTYRSLCVHRQRFRCLLQG